MAATPRYSGQFQKDAVRIVIEEGCSNRKAGDAVRTCRKSVLAAAHRRRLEAAGIECSMSRLGNCWDNACAERFFGSYKNEWVRHRRFADVESVRQSTFRYIEIYYNRRRLHQALGYLTPAEFERRRQESTAA